MRRTPEGVEASDPFSALSLSLTLPVVLRLLRTSDQRCVPSGIDYASMQPEEHEADLRAEHAEALCRARQSPFSVFGIALGVSVASHLLALPWTTAAHALSLNDALMQLGILKQPFSGLWEALRHMIFVSGGMKKMIAAARALKFARSAFSPTQPVIFTLKDLYSRAWILPMNPMYVVDSSLNMWSQWMVPHYVSGGLAGFTYMALLHVGSRLPLRDVQILGSRLPVPVSAESTPQRPSVGLPLPQRLWISAIPFTVHRALYHGTYDSLAPRNPVSALLLGLGVSFMSSAVADTVHNVTRYVAKHNRLERHGFAATAKARLVRAIPGGLALVLFDQARRWYCRWKT